MLFDSVSVIEIFIRLIFYNMYPSAQWSRCFTSAKNRCSKVSGLQMDEIIRGLLKKFANKVICDKITVYFIG